MNDFMNSPSAYHLLFIDRPHSNEDYESMVRLVGELCGCKHSCIAITPKCYTRFNR